MVMNNISKLNKCSNCGACYNICPVNAIDCNENEMFYKPIVNSDLCINYGLCVKECPIKEKPLKGNVIEAFGAFHAIAKKIIDNGGIVFGATFDDDYHSVVFKNIDEVDLKVKADFNSEQQDINLACYNIKSGYAKGEIILIHNEFVKYYINNGYKNSKEKYLKQKKTDEFKNRMIIFLKKVLK